MNNLSIWLIFVAWLSACNSKTTPENKEYIQQATPNEESVLAAQPKVLYVFTKDNFSVDAANIDYS